MSLLVTPGPLSLRPLPVAMREAVCERCDKSQANWSWEAESPDAEILCAICILYDTDWGKSVEGEVNNFLLEVGSYRGQEVPVDDKGRVSLSEAEGVVMAVAHFSRGVRP